MSSGHRTGLSMNRECVGHHNVYDKDHIERPERFERVLRRIEHQGLDKECLVHERAGHGIPEDLLHTVTSTAVVEELRRCEHVDKAELELVSSGWEDVFVCNETLKATSASAGVCLGALRMVLEGKVENAFALCRPPGHHASLSQGPCGFCFANNVALAVNEAQNKYGKKRILVVDWDVHAGQGTQYHVQGDPHVLFISIHRYEHGTFWPNLRESNWDAVGERGRVVNVPLNGVGFGPAEYLAIFHALVLPLAKEFDPDLIIVSCGFDAAIGDREGEMMLEPGTYAQMTRLLMSLHTPLLVVLEGGYFLESLESDAEWTLRSLLGHPIPHLPTLPDHIAAPVAEVLLNLMTILSPHWATMNQARASMDILREKEGKTHWPLAPTAVYKGSRDFLLPCQTRGIYPPRPHAVEDKFRNLLSACMGKYRDLVPDLKPYHTDDVLRLLSHSLK